MNGYNFCVSYPETDSKAGEPAKTVECEPVKMGFETPKDAANFMKAQAATYKEFGYDTYTTGDNEETTLEVYKRKSTVLTIVLKAAE